MVTRPNDAAKFALGGERSDWDTDLCQTRSGQSPCGSPGCPYGPGPGLHESAAGRAASADASAPSLRSPAGADSSGPSLQVSKYERDAEELIVLLRHDDLEDRRARIPSASFGVHMNDAALTRTATTPALEMFLVINTPYA